MSAEVQNAPLEEGLRKIFRGQDFFFLYSGDGDATLRNVWVYRRGEGAAFQPAAPEALESAKEIDTAINDSNPSVRLRAFRALLDRAGHGVLDTAIGALMREVDDGVRAGMLEALRDSGMELPSHLIPRLMNDPSEQIRALALEAVRGTPDARQLLTVALTDPSDHIKQRAKELLDEMQATAEQQQ